MNRVLRLTYMLLINRVVVDNRLGSKICETINYTLIISWQQKICLKD